MSWEEVLKNDNEETVPHKGIPTNRDEFYRSTFLNQAEYHEKELKRVKEFDMIYYWCIYGHEWIVQ